MEIYIDENKELWVCRVLNEECIIVKSRVDIEDDLIFDTVQKGKID